MNKIIGIKKFMTQIFDDSGKAIPATVVSVADVKVVRNLGVQQNGVNMIEIGTGKVKNITKAEKGQYKSLDNVPQHKTRVAIAAEQTVNVGEDVDINIFAVGDKIDVKATTKGKGFQGGVKRWGFHGGPKTHGQSDKHRSPGSIGSGTTVGRVFKGLHMAGHMGNRSKTIKNLKIVDVDSENKLLIVAGSVPGNNGGFVEIIKRA